MLLPALQQARERSRATQCLSNQKQLSAATMMYVGDSNDYFFPVWLVSKDEDPNDKGVTWAYYTNENYVHSKGVYNCPRFNINPKTAMGTAYTNQTWSPLEYVRYMNEPPKRSTSPRNLPQNFS